MYVLKIGLSKLGVLVGFFSFKNNKYSLFFNTGEFQKQNKTEMFLYNHY